MTEETVQVVLNGDVLLVHPDDVMRDSDGNVIAVRPRGHGDGSEADGTEGLRSAENEPSGA
jgi:hypothetical protein